jgi:tetratricopeptide (TPR) repeat protein
MMPRLAAGLLLAATVAGCAAQPLPPPALACQQAAEAAAPGSGALARCSRSIADPRLPQADRLASIVNRGVVRLKRGDLAGAADDFDLAIRAAPNFADAWVNKGIALARMKGREAEAVALISHGITLGPAKPARAYFARAAAHEAMGRAREAFEDYGQAAALDPDWAAPAEELKRFKLVRRKVLRA